MGSKIRKLRLSLQEKLKAARETERRLSYETKMRRLAEEDLDRSQRISSSEIVKIAEERIVDEMARAVFLEAMEMAYIQRSYLPESGDAVIHLRVPEVNRRVIISRPEMEMFRG